MGYYTHEGSFLAMGWSGVEKLLKLENSITDQ